MKLNTALTVAALTLSTLAHAAPWKVTENRTSALYILQEQYQGAVVMRCTDNRGSFTLYRQGEEYPNSTINNDSFWVMVDGNPPMEITAENRHSFGLLVDQLKTGHELSIFGDNSDPMMFTIDKPLMANKACGGKA